MSKTEIQYLVIVDVDSWELLNIVSGISYCSYKCPDGTFKKGQYLIGEDELTRLKSLHGDKVKIVAEGIKFDWFGTYVSTDDAIKNMMKRIEENKGRHYVCCL